MLAGSRLTKFVAIGAMMAGAVALAVDVADARPGGSKSYGSRGSNTYTAPPTTNTAPKAATPMDRTMTQPGRPTAGTPGPLARKQPSRRLPASVAGAEF
jgi:hypothetical protein